MRRTNIKRKTVNRDWSEALDKREEEGCCRACKIDDGTMIDGERACLECAHTIGRAKQDEERIGPRGGRILVVKRESTVPLCSSCHRLFDSHRLDLLPYLYLPEQVNAVESAGGIALANRRLSGRGE